MLLFAVCCCDDHICDIWSDYSRYLSGISWHCKYTSQILNVQLWIVMIQ